MRPFTIALAVISLVQFPAEDKRANELTLARLRPGVDTIEKAGKILGLELRRPRPGVDSRGQDATVMNISCGHRFVRFEIGDRDVIQGITVSDLGEEDADCKPADKKWNDPARLASGKGLALGQNCKRAIALYGEPDSRGPSTQSGRDLDLLYYQFDWAGPNVPQVMEVTCARPNGRVVQITLAFPSL